MYAIRESWSIVMTTILTIFFSQIEISKQDYNSSSHFVQAVFNLIDNLKEQANSVREL